VSIDEPFAEVFRKCEALVVPGDLPALDGVGRSVLVSDVDEHLTRSQDAPGVMHGNRGFGLMAEFLLFQI
jgi:hypothetical protein